MDMNKLRGKLAEERMSITRLAEHLDIDRATAYRKLGNGKFTIGEATEIKNLLKLSDEEARVIFLD